MSAIDIQTAKKLTKPKKVETQEQIKIPKMKLGTFQLTVEGMSPLMVQKFSAKAIRQIEDKQQKKAKVARAARDPNAEYEASLYVIDEKKKIYGIPASGLKNAAVSACAFCEGVFKTIARGAFHILAEPHGLIPIQSKAGPVMDIRTVRLSGPGRPADIRYRARFDDWKLTFKVSYNMNVLSGEQIANIFETAGFSIGLCEWRPEKNGSYGMFSLSKN